LLRLLCLLLLLLRRCACGVRGLAVLALMTLAISLPVALTVAVAITPAVTTSVARCCFVLVFVTTPVAIAAAVTLMATVPVAISIAAVTTFVPVASTFLRGPTGVLLRGRRRLGRRPGATEQEAPHAHEDADLLGGCSRLDRCDGRLHRDGRRRRNTGDAGRDHRRSRRRRRLRQFDAVVRRWLRHDRDLVADGVVLG